MAILASIYTISDPRTGLVVYVGKTNNVKERFRKHLTENNKTYKSKWVKGMRAIGLIPIFDVIDECDGDEWQDKEKFYIKLYKSFGAKLLNQCEGGMGGLPMLGKKLSQESKDKISASKVGKARPDLAARNTATKGFKIRRTDMEGNEIEIHPSIRHAATAIGRNYRRVQMMVSGIGKKINHVGGFKFEII